jgi:hypothetical protein
VNGKYDVEIRVKVIIPSGNKNFFLSAIYYKQ